MSFFSKKSSSFLGVDIGSYSIKIVELENRGGKPVLLNYAFSDPSILVQSTKTDDIIKNAASIIEHIYKQANFTNKQVIAALHNFDVFTSVINLPETKPSDLENVIKVEARKFVPIPLDDVILDWKVIEKSKKTKQTPVKQKAGGQQDREKFLIEQEGGIDILLTAAPRKLVSKYLKIFQASNLNLLSLETESFAFIRSLIDDHDTSSLMLIDIGAISTDIIIVENRIPVVIRTVDVGGSSITKAVSHSLGIDMDRAEQFKRDVGIGTQQEADVNNSSIAQMIENTFSPVVNEINYSIDLYKARNKQIEKILLSGGSSYLYGLVDFLKSTFNLPVFIGDPWHKIEYPKPLQETFKTIGPMFTVSIGLALKEIVE